MTGGVEITLGEALQAFCAASGCTRAEVLHDPLKRRAWVRWMYDTIGREGGTPGEQRAQLRSAIDAMTGNIPGFPAVCLPGELPPEK